MDVKLELALDSLCGEIERIQAFAENLAITEDYKMDVCFDEEGRCWEKLPIDASEISRDLLDLVMTMKDKYTELHGILESNDLGSQ